MLADFVRDDSLGPAAAPIVVDAHVEIGAPVDVEIHTVVVVGAGPGFMAIDVAMGQVEVVGQRRIVKPAQAGEAGFRVCAGVRLFGRARNA